MGIGKTDNYRFYEGYEYEAEVELSTNDENMETLHIWDGFFMDIFGEPSLDGNGWHGFTQGYHFFCHTSDFFCLGQSCFDSAVFKQSCNQVS